MTLPDGVPTTVTVERPRSEGSRRLRHQRRAAAGQEGRHEPARARRAARRASSTSADGIAGVEIAGPGFLNITRRGRRPGRGGGRRRRGRGGVRQHPTRSPARRSTSSSSPPTRPARSTSAASAGRRSVTRSAGSSTLTGAEVTREYYFNDHGAQIDRFARSLLASARGEPAPEDGYGGDYIARDRRRRRRRSAPTSSTSPTTRRRRSSAPIGVELMFAEIKQTLHDFGVDFDVYFHEDNLHKSGAVRAGDRAAHRARQHLREGRRALAAPPRSSATTRTGSIIKSDGQRRLPLRRPRLLPRQARARLRPLLHHARRRPPRLRRPDDGDVRRVRRRRRTRTSRS